MADISGSFWSDYSGPNSYWQISYSEIGRNGSSATYRFTIGVNLQYSTSSFGYPLTGHVSVNGTQKDFTIWSSGTWSGNAVKWFTVDVTCSAGSGGGTLNARVWSTRDTGGTTLTIDRSGTVNLSTWNTAPYWGSATCTVSPSGTIPENTTSLTVSWGSASDTEGNTRYYTVKRYRNGYYEATVVSNTTSLSVTDNIGSGNEGSYYYYTVEVNDGSLWASNAITSNTVTKNTMTGATLSSSGSIGFLSSNGSLAFTYSGASNTNGNGTFYYSLSCQQITVYNPTVSPTNVTIYVSGTLPTGTYIRFDEIKQVAKDYNYITNFTFVLTTTNAYGTSRQSFKSISVNVQTTPTAIATLTTSGTFTIGGTAYYIPDKKAITVTWGASTDPLGNAIKYDLYGKVGSGSYALLMSDLTTTTVNVSLSAVTSATSYTFRIIAKTTYGTTTTKDSTAITLHYYNPPTINFTSTVRSQTQVVINGTVTINSSISGLTVTTLSYIGKTSGNLTLGTSFSRTETGLLDTETFTFTVTAQDSGGVGVGTSASAKSVSIPRYTPALSVRKKGVGVNAFADDTYKFVVGGKTKFTDNQMTALGTQRIYNNLASFSMEGPNTGTIKITFPKSWSSTMFSITIKGYDYSNVGGWTLQVGGYNYIADGSYYNCSAKTTGITPFSSVRLAHDGSKCCLLLGTTTTVWRYPIIVVEQCITSFGGQDGWDSGWNISLITNETGITKITKPPTNVSLNPSFMSEPTCYQGDTIVLPASKNITRNFAVYMTPSGIAHAVGNSDATMPCIGVACHDATTGQDVTVLTKGLLKDSVWNLSVGTWWYVHPTNAGEWINVRPSAPGNRVQMLCQAITPNIMYVNPQLVWVTI